MTGFKGWEICARHQRRGLLLPPSHLFPFQSSISPYLVLTHSSRQARFYRTLKHKQEHPYLML